MREMRGDRGGNTTGHGNAPPMQPPPAPPTGMGLERGGGRPGGKVNSHIYISLLTLRNSCWVSSLALISLSPSCFSSFHSCDM